MGHQQRDLDAVLLQQLSKVGDGIAANKPLRVLLSGNLSLLEAAHHKHAQRLQSADAATSVQNNAQADIALRWSRICSPIWSCRFASCGRAAGTQCRQLRRLPGTSGQTYCSAFAS